MKATEAILAGVFAGGGSGGGGGSTIADQVYPFGATVTFNVSGVPAGEWRKFCDGDTSGYWPIYNIDGEGYSMMQDVVLTNGTTEIVLLSADQGKGGIGFGETLPAWAMTLDDHAELVDDEGWYWLEITGDTTIGLVPS